MLGIDFPYSQANSCRYEAVALQAWAGRASVELLNVDCDSGGMLLERCEPASRLADTVTLHEADTVAVDLLSRLWQVPPPALPDTVNRAREWARRCSSFYAAAGEPFERALLTSALTIADELSAPAGAPVLLHGDFHHNNVIAAQREPWLAIDPLPLVGEREYDVVMFLLFRKGAIEDPEETWGEAIESLCRRLDLDAARVKRWLYLRLIADALAFLSQDGAVEQLESRQEDLWSARLVLELLR
jgi:streptomycin 6-kinase